MIGVFLRIPCLRVPRAAPAVGTEPKKSPAYASLARGGFFVGGQDSGNRKKCLPCTRGIFFFVMKNRDEKIGIRKFGNRWVDKGEIHTVPAALPLLLLPDNEAAFFIRINGQG